MDTEAKAVRADGQPSNSGAAQIGGSIGGLAGAVVGGSVG